MRDALQAVAVYTLCAGLWLLILYVQDIGVTIQSLGLAGLHAPSAVHE